jgi:hypothetical protein
VKTRAIVPPAPSSAYGVLELELSISDEAAAVRIGEARNANATRNGWKPRLGPGTDWSDPLGARGEAAVARAYGAIWRDPERLDPDRQHAPDVGGVDVRTTEHADGHLPIREDDSSDRAHVLVLALGRRRYRIPGWIYGFDAKVSRYWSDRFACYWIPQDALLDPAWLPIERLPG